VPILFARQQSVDERCNFEHGPIVEGRDHSAIIAETIDDLGDAGSNHAKRIQHDADAVLAHPFGVIALLGHRQSIFHDDDRQPEMNGLADAARSRLADEEIAELHVMADLGREAEHEPRRICGNRPQLLGQGRVMSANQDQLRVGKPTGDAAHDARSMAAKQDDTGRQRRVETESPHFRTPIDRHRAIEIGTDDHARGRVNAVRRATLRTRLRHGLGRAANEML